MGKNRKKRRQPHGSAWYWKRTGCWYYTLPGTKKRVPLFDDQGQRFRGLDQKTQANLALAKILLTKDPGSGASGVPPEAWLVAKVCSDYLQYCERGLAQGTLSKGHRDNSVSFLNDLWRFCGALPVSRSRKGIARPGWMVIAVGVLQLPSAVFWPLCKQHLTMPRRCMVWPIRLKVSRSLAVNLA